MADRMMDQLTAAAMAGGLRTVPVPSEAQRKEIEKVQGLQVRTNAAGMATEMCQGKDLSHSDWLEWAAAIERYILGEAG